MVFSRFVEVGRVVLVNYGGDGSKLAVITDIIDHNRVIVDGPTTNLKRQVLSIRRLSLTKFTVPLPRGARSKTVKKVMNEAGVAAKWAETEMAKRMERQKIRRNLSDFDRFKAFVAKRKMSAVLKA